MHGERTALYYIAYNIWRSQSPCVIEHAGQIVMRSIIDI
jgi:hypothetical protein